MNQMIGGNHFAFLFLPDRLLLLLRCRYGLKPPLRYGQADLSVAVFGSLELYNKSGITISVLRNARESYAPSIP
jgi:hypothetical protein